MPDVDLEALHTALGEAEPTTGTVKVTYWAGARPFVRVDGSAVTFPKQITVRIVDGVPEEPLELEPTGDVCCVKWEIRSATAGRSYVTYTTIPDVPEVSFGDLPVVDRDLFTPTNDPTLIDQITQRIIDLTRDRF